MILYLRLAILDLRFEILDDFRFETRDFRWFEILDLWLEIWNDLFEIEDDFDIWNIEI